MDGGGPPDQAVPANDDDAHEGNAAREEREVGPGGGIRNQTPESERGPERAAGRDVFRHDRRVPGAAGGRHPPGDEGREGGRQVEIGRASCRERVEIWVVAVVVKKMTEGGLEEQ